MMQETKIRLHALGILSYVFNICPTNRLFKEAEQNRIRTVLCGQSVKQSVIPLPLFAANTDKIGRAHV